VLETEEESGSVNFLQLLDAAKDLIGKPEFLFCIHAQALDF
jgi:hypothetical protein